MGGTRDKRQRPDRGANEPIPFPQTRVRPPGGRDKYVDLGVSRMSLELGLPKEQATGHWCSRCKGIWFGYLLEVECPVCGGRNG